MLKIRLEMSIIKVILEKWNLTIWLNQMLINKLKLVKMWQVKIDWTIKNIDWLFDYI